MAQGAWVEKWSQWDLLKLNSFSFGITGFILAMDTVVLPVIVLTVAPEGFKNTYLAVLGISGLLMAATVQPTIGRISDRYQSRLGRRVPFILWGATFAAIGLIGIRLAPNFGVLFAVWIFIQANVNIAYGPGLALIRDCVPLDRIGMASSMKILSDAIGAAVMIAIAGALIGKTGSSIDWEWLTLGILAFLLMVGISVTTVQVSRRELNTPLNAQRRDIESSFRSVLNPQLGLFLISRLVMIMAISSFQTYGLFFLRDSVGLDDPAAALGRMILVIAGALAIAVYLAGLVSDRLGRKPVVMVGAIGAALSTMWMLTASNSTEALIIASVIGASIGVLLSANWALANELADEAQAGLHMGMVNLATIGGAAGAKMLGPGIDALNRIPGRSDDFGYQVLIAGAAGFFILGAILLMPLKTTGREAVSGDASPPPA